MGDYATLLKIITDYFREYNDDITYQELLEKVHFIFPIYHFARIVSIQLYRFSPRRAIM